MIDPATLRIRYPAFAAVPDATITYWLTDAGRIVTTDWGADQEPATLALAAHNMAITPGVVATSNDPQAAAVATVKSLGVNSFRSGAFSATISDTAVAAAVKGGYAATPYGQEFAVMLRRHSGGPQLVGVPQAPFDPYGYNAFGLGWLW